jgi:hypothetical protein
VPRHAGLHLFGLRSTARGFHFDDLEQWHAADVGHLALNIGYGFLHARGIPGHRGPGHVARVFLVKGFQFLSARYVGGEPRLDFHLHRHACLTHLRTLHFHSHDHLAGVGR